MSRTPAPPTKKPRAARADKPAKSSPAKPTARAKQAPLRERSLGLVLDPTSERPLYQQLFDGVAERIASGAFPAGYRLPPTRALSGELRTHRNTVVRAYRELHEAGFLASTVGRGTFVRDQGTPSSSMGRPQATSSLAWSNLLAERTSHEALQRVAKRAHRPLLGAAVDLSRMQPGPDILPWKQLARCIAFVLERNEGRALGYAPLEGAHSLRTQIALDLAKHGVPASEQDILVTSGSQQAIDLIARVLIDPGDTVLVQTPTYGGALQTFAAAGARVEGMANDSEGPLPPSHPRERVKLLYLMPNHANPTGQSISETRRRELARWARERGIAILEDDYAGGLDLEGIPAPPALRALDGDVLYTASFSKRLIPAMRIGFIVAPEALRPHLASMQHASSLGSSLVLQLALAEMLERGWVTAHVTRTREIYRARRDALSGELERLLAGRMEVPRPPRGLTTWLSLPSSIELEALQEQTKREGVLVATGDLFASSRLISTPETHGARLSFCFETEARLVEGARRFVRAFDALHRSPRSAQRSRMSESHERDESPQMV